MHLTRNIRAHRWGLSGPASTCIKAASKKLGSIPPSIGTGSSMALSPASTALPIELSSGRWGAIAYRSSHPESDVHRGDRHRCPLLPQVVHIRKHESTQAEPSIGTVESRQALAAISVVAFIIEESEHITGSVCFIEMSLSYSAHMPLWSCSSRPVARMIQSHSPWMPKLIWGLNVSPMVTVKPSAKSFLGNDSLLSGQSM